VASCCEHGNEHLGPIKSGEFLDYPGDYRLLKQHSVPWRLSSRITMNWGFHGFPQNAQASL
jgi:hypothetical protein